MKKKLLLVALLLVVALVCLSACGYQSTLDEITKLLNVNYSKITLNIETTQFGVTLKGIYNFTFDGDTTTIQYSVEKLNDPSADASFKSTETGTVVVRDGKIEGESSNLPDAVYYGGINFKQAYFKNIQSKGVRFEADVVNPQGFTGNRELKCSKMHVKVLHKEDALTQLVITYVAENGSNVNITYLFTK